MGDKESQNPGDELNNAGEESIQPHAVSNNDVVVPETQDEQTEAAPVDGQSTIVSPPQHSPL
jgi:hypothetical protein